MTELAKDLALVREIHSLTVQGLSAARIARKLSISLRPLSAAHIVGIWSAYGGQRRFRKEVGPMIESGQLVLPTPTKEVVEGLFSEEELVRFASLLMQRKHRDEALAIVKPGASVSALTGYLARRYKGKKAMSAFFEEYGPKVHEMRRAQA